MSIFGRIANRIFGRSSYEEASATPTPTGAPPATGATPSVGMGGGAMGGMSAASGSGASAASTPAMANPAAPAAMGAAPSTGQPVDVEAVITGMAQGKGSLNWRTSIVDLMKVLDLDSSLDARKELATELGYTGAKDGSAEMNIWLHKAVMTKLAQNGGVVPASMRD